MLAYDVERTWQADLDLYLEKRPAGTHLSRCRHRGPLYVQKPFYPEGRDHAHIYLLHPPGGIVSGDALTTTIQVGEDAGALVTTPGAARIYRAREHQPLQQQRTALHVAAGATLEWFPLEMIVYPDACVAVDTTISLQRGARFIGWEVTCLGLPASARPFASGAFRQRYQLLCDGEPVFIDHLRIDDDNRDLLHNPAGMAGRTVTGFLLAGPLDEAEREPLLAALREHAESRGMHTVGAVSCLGEWLVGRYLGDSAEQARALFTGWWHTLRPLVAGREACAPRIWST